jgi:hypothetical protein
MVSDFHQCCWWLCLAAYRYECPYVELKSFETKNITHTKKGVLIPPAFGVTGTPSQKGTGPPLSVQHRLLQLHPDNSPVSYVDYLYHTDLSTIVLHDHMEPGIRIAAQASPHTMVRVGMVPSAWIPTKTAFQSHVFIEQKLDSTKGVLQLRAQTTNPFMETKSSSSSSSLLALATAFPSVSASWGVSKHMAMFANINTNARGWIGTHYDRTIRMNNNNNNDDDDDLHHPPPERDETFRKYEGLDTMCRSTINIKAGAWIPIDYENMGRILLPSTTRTRRNHHQQQLLHGYAAINMLGATAAVHGSWKRTHFDDDNTTATTAAAAAAAASWLFQTPHLHTYFSANLNDEHQPPLQITLERDNIQETASIALSQVLAFDRWQFNILEDRAPKVRNTVAWTIRMESSPRQTTTTMNHEDSGEHRVSSQSSSSVENITNNHRIYFGAAWQINRGLAIKAVLDPQRSRLTTALLFKRWKHPRITCSVLSSIDPHRGMSLFRGVGIELETTTTTVSGTKDDDNSNHPDAYYYNHYPSSTTVVLDDHDYPKTKAVLPDETPPS